MNVSEAYKKKEELEALIVSKLRNYELETGLRITNVKVNINYTNPTIEVSIKAGI